MPHAIIAMEATEYAVVKMKYPIPLLCLVADKITTLLLESLTLFPHIREVVRDAGPEPRVMFRELTNQVGAV